MMTSFRQLAEALELMTTYEELTESSRETVVVPAMYLYTDGNFSYRAAPITQNENAAKLEEIANRFEEIYTDVVTRKNALLAMAAEEVLEDECE
jgi:hypothetical protein